MRHALASGAVPPVAAPLTLAFVGQSTFFEACALGAEVAGLRSHFVEFRKDADAGRLRRELEAIAPDVVVVFRPEIVPAGLLADLRALRVGFLTEPLPRTSGGAVDADRERRLWELRQVDAANFDRVVSFDPLIAATAHEHVPVWRSLPLPVADRFYVPAPRREGPPRALFVGRSTPHREWMLTPAKHAHGVVHLAFGVGADDLAIAFREHDVGINVHNQRYASFENRICLHLAAGHLVLSEALSPSHGIELGIDYVEIETPDGLASVLESMRRFPNLHHRVRVRGRRKAEQFRASRVWPRLVHDLLADVRAFGRSPA
jgi:hypothetical protein